MDIAQVSTRELAVLGAGVSTCELCLLGGGAVTCTDPAEAVEHSGPVAWQAGAWPRSAMSW